MTMNHVQGRASLADWEAHKPQNFFLADTYLQAILQTYLGADAYANAHQRLSNMGAFCATTMDVCAKQEDKIGNHPRLERFSAIGEREERIEFHPNHDTIGREIWASGIMALQAHAGNTVLQMGLYYLLAMNGEGGHLCSLACTSGLIRALQVAADENTRAKFLSPLLDPHYDTKHHGAQFLTEVQGGSDVGANSIVATAMGDGTWRINGEKWFCSNVNAEQFLLTARASDAHGTRGLGLFLVPRTQNDGTTNGFYVRRLKDKLGTRTLASAELDFREAIAYPIGAIETGFKTVVEWVLNTSRLMNAVACAGIMRRAYYEASHYACHRQAFGNPIANYPLVQEAIADLHSETVANTASSFYLAHLIDQIESGRATAEDHDVYRLLVNVNKYITSIRGTEMVHRAIEVLGGNGAIESFSILPRLYRDMVVLESWEGTHNVLALQVMRDIGRLAIHEAFFSRMNALLFAVNASHLANLRQLIANALDDTAHFLQRLQQGSEAFQHAHARRLLDRLGTVTQAVLVLHEAHTHPAPHTLTVDLLTHFVNKHLVTAYDALEDTDYLARLERIITHV